MSKKDYYPYVYQDPSEVKLFKEVFGDLSIGNEVKHRFEICRKGPLMYIGSDKTYTISNFQECLMDRYGLDYSKAYAIYWYLVFTRIWGLKPKDAIHDIASEFK